MVLGMPTQPRKRPAAKDNVPVQPKRNTCKALTTSGERCKRQAVTGLTVCKSHGGGTAASVSAGKRASVSQQAHTLWGLSTDTSGISVEGELTKLARNKITDILALRLELSRAGAKHIGLLTETTTMTEYDITGTVQSKEGTQETRSKRAGTSPWVAELHKAENELIQILKLLQEVTGGSEEVDTRRIRMQTAREAARLIKAFPGISVDEVAAEVSKRAG